MRRWLDALDRRAPEWMKFGTHEWWLAVGCIAFGLIVTYVLHALGLV